VNKSSVILLDLFDGSKLPQLPEGIILVDSILFSFMALLLLYSYCKTRQKQQTNSYEKNDELISNNDTKISERDILMQPKSSSPFLDAQKPLSNFSVRNALFWLLVIFVIFNLIYFASFK
jgi:hypothetical protein